MATKYCTDCKFFVVKDGGTVQYGKCSAPDALRDGTQLLSPEFEIESMSHASTMRNNAPYCGVDAKWFEPKAEA